MKRIFLVALAIVLVACLIFSGCAAPALEPAAPTAPVHEPYEITIWTIPAGTGAYAINVVLASDINKMSTWLKADCPEGLNPIVHVKEAIVEGTLKNSIFFCQESNLIDMNQHIGATADPPWNTFNFWEFRQLWFLTCYGTYFVTLNPEIKTIKDLDGKRVMVDTVKGGTRELDLDPVWKYYGITIKKEYLDIRASAQALKDGLIDAILGGSNAQIDGTWIGAAGTPELVATDTVYFIHCDPEAIEFSNKETGRPFNVEIIPPGQLAPTQTEPLPVISKTTSMTCHQSVPDEVVTEILRIVYETCETWKEYRSDYAQITKQTLAAIDVPESRYHPAALKFYKEKGVPIGAFPEIIKMLQK